MFSYAWLIKPLKTIIVVGEDVDELREIVVVSD
jgi:hypothetical protein